MPGLGTESFGDNLVSEDIYPNDSAYDASSNGQLTRLPADLILKIAFFLEDYNYPADFCHFASLTPKNWTILEKECHQLAFKVAEPTQEEFKKYLTDTGGVSRYDLWEEVQDSTDIGDRSKFTEAITNGCLHAVTSFLLHGVNPNTFNITGNRPLTLAASCPCPVEMSELLLKHGSNPNSADFLSDIFTPLYTAATMAQDDLVHLLLDHGANLKEKGVVQAICQVCKKDTIQRAFKMGADINEIDEAGNNMLHFAARNEDPEVLRLVFDLGFPLTNINQQNKGGKTPLMKAVKIGHIENVAALIACGATPDPPLANGTTALHVACSWDHIEIASLLVNAGANLEAVDGDQLRPIHHAVYITSIKMLRLVVENGADASATTRRKDTALHVLLADLTEKSGKTYVAKILDCVKLLVAANANPTAQNDDGETPLKMAMKCGQYEIAHVLKTQDPHAIDDQPPTGHNWREYLREHVYKADVA
uniref:Ankyrin-3 n=1 Tax=Talaromyces marneffei PM1 TaxID=1077442 RepID=A0A093V1D6_TALMA